MGGTLLNNGNFTYVNNENSTNTARYDNHRRSVYLPVIRNTVFDFFQVFDFAEPHVPNGKRASTVVAPQALYLMNSPFVPRAGRARSPTSLLKEPGTTPTASGWRICGPTAARRRTRRSFRRLEYLSRYEAALAATEKDAVEAPAAGLAVVLPGAVRRRASSCT